MFKKAVIIGTGLIGGSLGLAIKQKKLCRNVYGMSRSVSNASWARSCGAVDSACSGFSAISDADLIILATPPEIILKQARRIARLARKDAVIFDVSSTKREIVSLFSRLHRGFVGTHPLAGSEKRGIRAASAKLFQGCVCILTPAAGTDKRALHAVESLWKNIGARTMRMDSRCHDALMASISHLPHIAAFALMNSIRLDQARLGAGGLRDTTRIAASDPQLWSQILFSNRDNIISPLKSFQRQLTAFQEALRSQNKRRLTALISSANRKRRSL
jgi:prephenate dehydrogenase